MTDANNAHATGRAPSQPCKCRDYALAHLIADAVTFHDLQVDTS